MTAMLELLNYYPDREMKPVRLPGSKSIAARALILNFINKYKGSPGVKLEGLPRCEDTLELEAALCELEQHVGDPELHYYNLGTGGTTLRFFTALAASIPGFSGTLDCSEALKRRPIKPLLDALRQAGADITGDFPPLRVKGRRLSGEGIPVSGDVSSQFASALMLGSGLWHEVDITYPEHLVSRPYLEMTRQVIADFGKQPIYRIEGDWSAASYFYELALVRPETEIRLLGLTRHSLQGDSACQRIFERFGVYSEWEEIPDGDSILILRGHAEEIDALKTSGIPVKLDLRDTPDLVPALAVGACMARIPFLFTGVGHLRHKESDRMQTLAEELGRVGFDLTIGEDSLGWDGRWEYVMDRDEETPEFHSHGDHRIAMALAMTAAAFGSVLIEGSEAIDKSFPGFLSLIGNVGIELYTWPDPIGDHSFFDSIIKEELL